jgi:Pentapeptide repeats (9 copies)
LDRAAGIRGGTMSAVRVRVRFPWFWLIVLLAAVALVLVTWWVSAGGANRGDALKTGGLAGGAIVAIYALWINDRRRRVEETRIRHDEERVADERFARAVELLGHDSDQVRVGAMYALTGLAVKEWRYKQIVLDVLCAYLRRPFELPAEGDDAVREQQVRMTAQRLIPELLQWTGEPQLVHYNLDLHGATLEYFDISHLEVGELRMRATKLHESTSLRGVEVYGPAWFTGATCPGRLYAPDIVFHDRCWFSGFDAHGTVDFERAKFKGRTKFANAIFRGPVSFEDATFSDEADFSNVKVSTVGPHRLPDGFRVEPIGKEFGLVRAVPGGYVAGQ